MPSSRDAHSRRSFALRATALSVAALAPADLFAMASEALPTQSGDFDLSWTALLKDASDKAVADSPSSSDIAMQLAARFLDNCDAAYGAGKHSARVVVNFRTAGAVFGLNDAMWAKYTIGEANKINDRATQQPATRNPFMNVPPGQPAAYGAISDLVSRKAIILVCDFALTNTARRFAEKAGRPADEVHKDLRANLVKGAYAVPSGIFGLAKSQNMGCAFIPSPG